MTIKTFIKLFIPPFCLKIYSFIFNKKKNEYIEQKELAYNFYVEVLKRRTFPFKNIDYLSRDFTFEQLKSISTDYSEANFYGDYFVLKNYSGISFPILPPKKFTIQHGIIFFPSNWEDMKKDAINLMWSKIVASDFNKKYSCNRAIPIGCPFFYSDFLLTESEIKKERLRLGTNLLAFPMHSTHWTTTKFNKKSFIQLLKEQKKIFNSVRVCLYWKDIQNGEAELYLREGFECVSCGHIFDPYFLPRLKSLIRISDATISNSLGSQAGYSIFMNKPHWIVPDPYEVLEEGPRSAYDTVLKVINDFDNNPSLSYIKTAFLNNSTYQITNLQKKIVDDYWGVANIKSKEEICNILLKCYISNGDFL